MVTIGNKELYLFNSEISFRLGIDGLTSIIRSYFNEREMNEGIFIFFSKDRRTEQTKELLNEYKGYVVCDNYAGYDFLKEKGIKVQRCWVHIRRYFYDAIKILREKERPQSPAYKVYTLINHLFKYEKEMVNKEKTQEEIVKIRNGEQYKKLLKEIDDEINTLKKNITKDGLILKAVNYYENIKEKGELYTFLENEGIEIDNNSAERTVKPFVIGRKNFMFCKTKAGADITAMMYSILQTAINNVYTIRIRKYRQNKKYRRTITME